MLSAAVGNIYVFAVRPIESVLARILASGRCAASFSEIERSPLQEPVSLRPGLAEAGFRVEELYLLTVCNTAEGCLLVNIVLQIEPAGQISSSNFASATVRDRGCRLQG